MRIIKHLLTGFAIALSLSSTAHADLINFDLTDPDSRSGIYNSTYAEQYNYEEDGIGLAVTGWSYGIETTTTRTCTRRNRFGNCSNWRTTTSTSVNDAIEQEYVGKWDGLGVERADTPNHAVDNEDGDFDMLLLSFGEMVELLDIDLGWISGDSDISILAFNGGSFGSSSLLGLKWEDLIGNGWQSAGNYYNVDYGSNSGAVNQGGITSQYWLIGAYNDNLGNFTGSNRNISSGDDYFKVKGVTVNRPPVEVPEPGSLLLLALGLLSLCTLRRRAA
jgi:hypothetical protein